MKGPIVGYIVSGPDGPYIAAPPDRDTPDILWHGRGVTIFPTRKAANRILKATRKYGMDQGYGWTWFDSSFVYEVRQAA
jgi:hypothetical protein